MGVNSTVGLVIPRGSLLGNVPTRNEGFGGEIDEYFWQGVVSWKGYIPFCLSLRKFCELPVPTTGTRIDDQVHCQRL
jgi:hypothetical protein